MSNLPPLNLLHLHFDSIQKYTSYWSEFEDLGRLIWSWHESVGDRNGIIELSGICDFCYEKTSFVVTPTLQETHGFKYRASWPDLRCRRCGFDARDRDILTYLKAAVKNDQVVYHVGYHSEIGTFLRTKLNNIICSQYNSAFKSGFIDDQNIRYEDITTLSFSNDSVNYVVCSEILEHIPDYKAALREMHRILRKDGQAILTFPWLGGDYYEHLTRAELMPDGTITHYLPPEFHGDPASSEGILSFRAFGWQIMDELREAGFRRAHARYKFGPLHGYMALNCPIIIGIK